MSEERMNSPKNVLGMLLVFVVAIIINPFVKLKDWLKGEHE
jgi:hypothetical protein